MFILSDKEAKQYFKSDKDRMPGGWYLRTVNPVLLSVLNYYKPIAMYVMYDGEIYQNTWTVDYGRSVRPAIWLDVSSYIDIAN